MRPIFTKIAFLILALSMSSCSRTIEEKDDIETGVLCDEDEILHNDWCLRNSEKYLIGQTDLPCYETMVISFKYTEVNDFSENSNLEIYGVKPQEDVISPLLFELGSKTRFLPWYDCREGENTIGMAVDLDVRAFYAGDEGSDFREVLFITYFKENPDVLDSTYVQFSPLNF